MFPVLLWTVCSSAVLASTQLLKLDFSREPIARAPLNRRYLELPMYNDIFHQRYTVNVSVGTPPQPATLLLDTGSSDFWLPQPNSWGCAPTCPPGSFDTKKSSTYQALDVPYRAYFGFTPDDLVVGQYFRDTARIGSAVIPDMTVANVTKTMFFDGIYGIIGLGARLAESTFRSPTSSGPPNPNSTFPTLYDQLQAHGYTARRAFSIWQNKISATTGRIIFGGIDTTKYYGKLSSVPVQLNQGLFLDWGISLTSVARHSHGQDAKRELLTAPGYNVTAILDSGSPNIYLPLPLFQSISSAMNTTIQFGFPYVPCDERRAHSSLEFGLGGPSGPRINVPYSALIYPFGAPANIGPVVASDGTQLCYLGVNGVNGTIFLLGDTFIRSAYMVYDVDNLQIAMAQARYDVDEENIVEIAAGTDYCD